MVLSRSLLSIVTFLYIGLQYKSVLPFNVAIVMYLTFMSQITGLMLAVGIFSFVYYRVKKCGAEIV